MEAEDRKDGSEGENMTGLPQQVDQAGKRSEDLLKLHQEGKGPDDEGAPEKDQDRQPEQGDLQKQLSDLQAKYDVLSGKYKKEIENADLKDLQRLQNEVVNLKRQNQELTAAVKSSENLVKEVREELEKKKTEPEPVNVEAVLSEEEREYLEAEDLGGKTLEILLKLSRAAGGTTVEGQLKDIANQVKATAKRIEESEKRIDRSERTQTEVTLKSVIPDFEKVNSDPKFHSWLDDPVSEFSPRKKRDDLQEALGAGDFDSVRRGIDAFKKETGWGKAEKPKPKTHIEPDESFTGGEGAVSVKRDYTMKEINDFYIGQTKGKWAGREKEAAAIDRDIQLAIAEGRIKQQ